MCSSFPGLLIGRTAVHSGKDPAFVAYDQFLSTGILQPLSRGEVRCGSNPIFEVMSAARPLFYRKRKSIGGLAKSFVHGDQGRHRRCFVWGLLCFGLRWTCPLGERQVPKSGPGIPRSTAPRTVAPGLTVPPTWTPGLMAPPIWADSAVGIMRIAATAPIIESLPGIRPLLAQHPFVT